MGISTRISDRAALATGVELDAQAFRDDLSIRGDERLSVRFWLFTKMCVLMLRCGSAEN